MSASQRPTSATEESPSIDALSPTPVFARLDGPPVAGGASIVQSIDTDARAWRELADLQPESLAPEGYALRVRESSDGPQVLVAARDDTGLFRAETTLAALAANGPLPQLSIRDEPALAWRGTIEGFYGPPWTHQARLEHLRFLAANKCNSYAYAPKDDRYHRVQWRDLYPEAELARLAELVAEASRLHVKFIYTLAPGLSMTYSSADERALLYVKAEQLAGIGVRAFALLFDDIESATEKPEDTAEYGAGERGSGLAHGRLCADFTERFLKPRGLERLVMVPTDYSGVAPSAYRTALAETLPDDALVWWTGSDVVVGEVTRADIDAAADSYQRDLLLWDNFPVNDFDFARLFLGPLLGRATDLSGSRLVGVNANPMVHATASQFALVSVADWAWNPSAYVPERSAERALTIVAGSMAETLRPLVAVSSAWPPSRERSPEFAAATTAALGRDAEALETLDRALGRLVDLPRDLADADGALIDEMRPWIESAAAEARVARAATEMLAGGSVSASQREQLHRELDDISSREQNVLRTLLGDYVRSVIDASAPAG